VRFFPLIANLGAVFVVIVSSGPIISLLPLRVVGDIVTKLSFQDIRFVRISNKYRMPGERAFATKPVSCTKCRAPMRLTDCVYFMFHRASLAFSIIILSQVPSYDLCALFGLMFFLCGVIW
jgi:hypothetical protein